MIAVSCPSAPDGGLRRRWHLGVADTMAERPCPRDYLDPEIGADLTPVAWRRRPWAAAPRPRGRPDRGRTGSRRPEVVHRPVGGTVGAQAVTDRRECVPRGRVQPEVVQAPAVPHRRLP